MRKLFALMPAAVLTAALFAQAPAGTKAPAKATAATARSAGEFVIHMADGPDKLLSAYRGKVVVMAFMYTTCPHCQHTAGVLSKIQSEYAARGVQMLGVTFDVNAKQGVPGFIKLTGANFPVGYS